MDQSHDQQSVEPTNHHVSQAGHGSGECAGAQREHMHSEAISGMADRWTGQNSDRRGCGQDNTDFLGVQSALAEQRRQEG